MGTIYINTRQSEEHRIVIVKDGHLTGFEQDIVGWENRKGDIYKAVVTRIEEGLDAAFVNFGESKNGFLPLKYVAPELSGADGGERKLAEGDSVLVQIKKDHVGDKGAGMTTNISLAGCYLVLMPNTKRDKTMMSKNIGGRDRRRAAEALAELNVPEGMSVIVRTAGLGRPREDLRWDLECYLLKLWRAVESAAQNNRGPVLIYRENNLMLRAVRDYYRPGEDEIYCDDADSFRELKNFMELISPENAECVHYYEGAGAMVPDLVERQIDEIYKREIKTASGARVVFDVAEAMVAVDVNSGQMRGQSDIEATALRANMDAAEVVARHLRLRDMSGLIVVDFIDMTTEENRRKLEEYFIGLLRKDRARVQWTPLSRFGMMELSRQRLSRPVEESQSVVCQTCRGTGRQRRPESFALRLLRQIRALLPDEEVGALVVQAPADAAVYLLNEKRVELRRLEDEYNCEILVAPLSDMHPPDFTVRKIKSDGRVGVSYQARGGGEEKIRAEEMRRRFEKRDAGAKKPLIQTVMPEERVAEAAPKIGVFGRLWKAARNMFRSDSAAEDGRPDDKKRGGQRRGGAAGGANRRPQQRRETRDGAPKTAAGSSPAESGGAGNKKKRGGQRRRSPRRFKTEGETAAALQSDSQSPKKAPEDSDKDSATRPAESAAPPPVAKSASPESAGAESAAKPPDDKKPRAAESESESKSETSARTDVSVPESESAQSESAETPVVPEKTDDKKSRAGADDSGADKTSPPATNGDGGEKSRDGGDDSDSAADDGEEFMPLAARLARRYGKGEAEISAALAATGDAGSECMDEIPPELTARLDAYFNRRAARTADAANEPLHKVETVGDDDAPAELRQQVRELTAEDGGGDTNGGRPSAAEESPALRQVETVSEDPR